MATQYTISQLAKAAGIPVTTVRYYERIRLVVPENRSSGNYRIYGDESLQKLQFIRAAQAIGFTLEDIKSLLATERGATPTCGNVQGLIETRLTDIEDKLKDLRHVRKVLTSALVKCQQHHKSDRCHVVVQLRTSEWIEDS